MTRHSNSSARPLNIMICEDHPLNRALLENMLRKLGVNTYSFEDGAEAVEALSKHILSETDCILMDCEMPNLDGLEATKKIREFERKNNIAPTKIFALSAHNDPAYYEKIIECGMNDRLCKPITLDSITEFLGTLT